MSNEELLNTLGRKIMQEIRDPSIKGFDDIVSGNVKAKELIELHMMTSVFDIEQSKIIRKLILESIDAVIFNMLNLFEQNEEHIKLLISQSGYDEKNVVNISDGLAGELYSEDGWIEKFSKYK